MKFDFSAYILLDTKELLTVNGGSPCGGSSSYSGGGEDGTDWDANNKTVDQIYNEHFVGKDVAFDGKQVGKKGYILYDWEGDGKYDYIEFGSISEAGLSYSYYSNKGFENGENYYTRSFAQDSNADAKPDSPGTVRFIPLN